MRLVCINGIHRSGTSLVARVLNLLGVDLGPEEALMPATKDNPRGYWEAQDISDLNEAILGHLGGRWHRVPALPEGWEGQRSLEPFRERAERLIEELFAGAQTAGFKDPRASLLLPFWRRVAQIETTVSVVRSPDEVAGSLESRNGFEPERSADLWIDYIGSACAHSAGQVIVSYGGLLRAPRRTALWVAEELGLPRPDEEILGRIEGACEPGLRRNEHYVADYGPKIHTARELFKLLIGPQAEAARLCLGQLFVERNANRVRSQEMQEVERRLRQQDRAVQQFQQNQGDIARTQKQLEDLQEDYDKLVGERNELLGELDLAKSNLYEAEAESARRFQALAQVQQRADRSEDEARRLRSRRSVRVALATAQMTRPAFRLVRRIRSSGPSKDVGARTNEGAGADYTASEAEAASMQSQLEARLPPQGRTTGPMVSIVVLNRNGCEHLERLLTRLRCTEYQPFELIVVDNASKDGSQALIAEEQKNLPVTLIANDHNATFSEGNNQGLAAATGDLILLLNNDVEPVGTGWLGHLVGTLVSHDASLVGARLIYPRRPGLENAGDTIHPDLTLQHRGIHFELGGDGMPKGRNMGAGEDPFTPRAEAIREVPAVTAACLLARREVVEEVGGLTEGYKYGTEDVDLCLKARENGYRIVYDGQAVLWHHEYGTQNREGEEWKRQNRIHNRKKFVDAWGPRLFRDVLVDKLCGLGQLSETSLHVAITVTKDDPNAGYGDWYVATEMGAALESLGWSISFVERYDERWYQLGPEVDVLLVLLDRFELPRAPSHVTTVAWVRNWTERWLAQPWFEDYDLVLVSSVPSKELIESRTSKVAHVLPLATNPRRFRAQPSSGDLECDVVFVGSYWNQPRDVVEALLSMSSDIDVRIYGHGWEKNPDARRLWYGPLDYERVPAAYASARIVVDDTAEHARPYGALNSRVFDALASGGLVITDNSAGAAEIFDDDFPVWRDQNELNEMVGELLSDRTRLDSLVERYQDRVREEHTYLHRATEMREILKWWAEAERTTILVGVPRRDEIDYWGDYHFARSLQRQVERQYGPARVALLPEWERADTARDDLVVHLFGLSDYFPRVSQTNILWNISHPALMTADRCEKYDMVCIASDKFARKMAGEVTVPVHGLAQASDTERFYPDPTGPAYELLFVGNSRGVRRRVIDDLRGSSYKLAIFGGGWTEDLVDSGCVKGELVPNHELRRYYSSAVIVLNDHWDDMKEFGFISNRVYDALACGACVVSDGVEGLEERFGDAVTVYRSQDELHELIEFLMRNPSERRCRGEVGRRMVLENHTFSVRTGELLALVDPIVAAQPKKIVEGE